mgnify:CR=1 FL=1
MPARLDLEVETGENTVSFDLAISSTAGRAVDPKGDPLQGASVAIRRSVRAESARISRQFLGMAETDQKTGTDGSFLIKGVKSDAKLQLVVKASGFTDRVLSDLSVGAGQTLDVGAVQLVQGGSVLVLINGAESNEGVAWVTLAPQDPESSEQSKIELVRAGRAQLRALGGGGAKAAIGRRPAAPCSQRSG